MNWYKIAQQSFGPYWRVITDSAHGAGSLKGDRVGPGTYWTPRWDAVQHMVQMSGSLLSSMPVESRGIKIYKVDKAEVEKPPAEHKLPQKGYEDHGEVVMVRPLSEVQLIYDFEAGDETWESIVQSPREKFIDYSSRNPSVTLSYGRQAWISPNYRTKKFDVAVRNPDGWSFDVIASLDQAELDDFLDQSSYDPHGFDPDASLDYAIQDWNEPVQEKDRPQKPVEQRPRRSTRKPF